jgi:outer membrane protein assembly factor BamA
MLPRPPVEPGCQADRVAKVTVSGASRIDVAPLAVLEGTRDDRERLERTTQVATDFLHARGYPLATISVQRHRGCGMELAIDVDKGPRYRISDIELHSDSELPGNPRAALEDGLGTINAVGGAYVKDRLTRALDALMRRYRDAGWLDASAEPPKATWDEDDHTVHVDIQVHPGRRYRIGKLVAQPSVMNVLGLKDGEWFEASAVRTAIDRARRRLSRRLTVKMSVESDTGAIDLEVR